MNLTQLFQEQAMDLFQTKVQEMLGSDVASNKETLNKALASVLGQLGKNGSNPEEANNILGALDKHTNSGINLDLQDGQNILSHIFGEQKEVAEKGFAKKTNLDSRKSSDLLSLASSFVMENLGNAKAEGKLDSTSLSGLKSVATNSLDQDGDGSMVDDIIDIGKGFLFGKK